MLISMNIAPAAIDRSATFPVEPSVKRMKSGEPPSSPHQ